MEKQNNIEMKRTAKGCGYWQDNGAYQQEYEKLWNELVPAEGEAETVNGEILRASSKLYHEFFNNGNMNACECNVIPNYDDQDEDYEEEYDYTVSPYYQRLLDFLNKACSTDYEMRGLLQRIADMILIGENACNVKDNEHVYDLMVDHAIYWVLTHDNEPMKK